MTRIVKLIPLIAYLRIALARLPTDGVGTVGYCDETTNSNLHLLTTPNLNIFGKTGGVVPLTISLPDMNDETGVSTVSVGLNCEIKPPSTCGRPNGLKCYHCVNSEGFDGQIVVNEETGFLIAVLNNGMENTKYEIRTDGKAQDVQSQFRYRGVSMKDVTISVDGIPVPYEGGPPVTVGPNERRLAVREAYAPARSSEVLPTKRTDVDRVGRALASDDGSVVDLLYFFSYRGACQWLEQDYPCTLNAAAQAELETMVGQINAYGNNALNLSGIPTSFNVVKVHVDQTYDEGTSVTSSNRLYWVKDSLVAGNLRDEYNADLVVDVFYTNFNGAMGIGFVPAVTPDRSVGFSSSGGIFSLLDSVITHEIGHNFGARHDRYVEGGGVGDESFYGYINCDLCFKTIMSYSNECSGICGYVQTIPYFSNPDSTYNGSSMGDSLNNNVLQLTSSAPGIAINRFSYGKSIFSPNAAYYTSGFKALKFDINPKKDLTLKNIELEVTNNMEISVYIVMGSYADVTAWGDPIVTETLTPLSNSNSKLANVALYNSFPDTLLNANQGYAIRIERNVNDANERMVIASVQSDGDYLQNDDVIVTTGRFSSFSGYEYPNVAGLRGGLIYDVTTNSPTTAPIPEPTAAPIPDPTAAPITDPTAAPIPDPTAAPITDPTATPITDPTAAPITDPTAAPITDPTAAPITDPTAAPITDPTAAPITDPTAAPITDPTAAPITDPTAAPITDPTAAPITDPTAAPITDPTAAPITDPTPSPSHSPSHSPSQSPPTSCTENGTDEFLWKKKKKGEVIRKTCEWLSKRPEKKKKKDCRNRITMTSQFSAPQYICRVSCESCDPCYENPKSKFLLKLGNNNARYKSCKWLSNKKKKSQERLCTMLTDTNDGYGPPADVCPKTCSVCQP